MGFFRKRALPIGARSGFGPFVHPCERLFQTDPHRYPKLIASFSAFAGKLTSRHLFPKSMTRSNDRELSSTAGSKQPAGMVPKDDEYYIESSFVVFKARHIVNASILNSFLGTDRSRIVYSEFPAISWYRNRKSLEACLCFHRTAKDQTQTTLLISNSTRNQILET